MVAERFIETKLFSEQQCGHISAYIIDPGLGFSPALTIEDGPELMLEQVNMVYPEGGAELQPVGKIHVYIRGTQQLQRFAVGVTQQQGIHHRVGGICAVYTVLCIPETTVGSGIIHGYIRQCPDHVHQPGTVTCCIVVPVFGITNDQVLAK